MLCLQILPDPDLKVTQTEINIVSTRKNMIYSCFFSQDNNSELGLRPTNNLTQKSIHGVRLQSESPTLRN